jgi:hypothetical protein
MRHRIIIGAWVMAGLLIGPPAASAQLPGGVQIPGGASLPTGGFSKDALLNQAKTMLTELTAMKDSGKLAAEQLKQVDTLLPKATSLTTELAKPQIEATRLPQLASDVSELQKQVTALKGILK